MSIAYAMYRAVIESGREKRHGHAERRAGRSAAVRTAMRTARSTARIAQPLSFHVCTEAAPGDAGSHASTLENLRRQHGVTPRFPLRAALPPRTQLRPRVDEALEADLVKHGKVAQVG